MRYELFLRIELTTRIATLACWPRLSLRTAQPFYGFPANFSSLVRYTLEIEATQKLRFVQASALNWGVDRAISLIHDFYKQCRRLGEIRNFLGSWSAGSKVRSALFPLRKRAVQTCGFVRDSRQWFSPSCESNRIIPYTKRREPSRTAAQNRGKASMHRD
jgi:hypothetical protein